MHCFWSLPTSKTLKAVSRFVRKKPACSSCWPEVSSLPTDLSPEEITNALQLNKLKDRLWYVVPSVATEGTGIFEGLVSSIFFSFLIYWRVYWLFCRLGFRITSKLPALPNRLLDQRKKNGRTASFKADLYNIPVIRCFCLIWNTNDHAAFSQRLDSFVCCSCSVMLSIDCFAYCRLAFMISLPYLLYNLCRVAVFFSPSLLLNVSWFCRFSSLSYLSFFVIDCSLY